MATPGMCVCMYVTKCVRNGKVQLLETSPCGVLGYSLALLS